MPRAKRNHRRTILFATLCVVLGLMTSVGVAWGVVYRHRSAGSVVFLMDLGRWRVYDVLQSTGPWSLTQHRTAALTTNEFAPALDPETLRFRRALNAESDFEAFTQDAASRRAMARHSPLLQSIDGACVRFEVELAGWPLRCVASERACDADRAKSTKALILEIQYLKDQPSYQRAIQNMSIDPAFNLLPHYNAIEIGDTLLPTFPLWPGLLANTAIYGSAWASIIGGPILIRRWLRARRGGCAHCGYSREGLKLDAPCPECGRVPAAATVASAATPQSPSV